MYWNTFETKTQKFNAFIKEKNSKSKFIHGSLCVLISMYGGTFSNRKPYLVALFLIIALIAVLLTSMTVPVSATENVSSVRCVLVDDWIRPTTEPLESYWNENVGVGCNG